MAYTNDTSVSKKTVEIKPKTPVAAQSGTSNFILDASKNPKDGKVEETIQVLKSYRA